MYSYSNYKKSYPNITKIGAKNGLYPCFYCGVKSESIDHFIPVSFIENIKAFVDVSDTDEDIKLTVIKNQLSVPACKECNCLASDGVFNTPNQKKTFLKAKLKKRYRRLLDIPYWEREEIDELGYILKTHVENGENLKELVKHRIVW